MLRQIFVFVLVLAAINLVLYLLHVDFRISIVGSLVVSAIVTVIMSALQRRR